MVALALQHAVLVYVAAARCEVLLLPYPAAQAGRSLVADDTCGCLAGLALLLDW